MDSERDRQTVRDTPRRSGERLVIEIVLNRRRRYALYHLYEQSDPVALDDLSAQVAAWERAATPEEVTADHTESVSASLRRTHVPYLVERGLVAYDPLYDQVVGQIDDPDVELYLQNDPRTSIAWCLVYLALTAVATLLLAMVQFDVPPFGGLAPITVAGLIVAAYAMASVSYWYDLRRWRYRTENRPPDFLVEVEEDVSYHGDQQSENDDRTP